MSCVITGLQLKKMSVMYESAHDAITFHLLSIYHNNRPETIINIRTRYIFQRVLDDFTELHNEKKKSGSYV